MSEAEERAGISLSHLDQPLFDGTDVTKRELVDYLDAVADRLIPELSGRPLSVIRVRPGSKPFMQKNLPAYAPDWIPRVGVWAQASHREVNYALCEDRRTLIWFANQRAVEYHPTMLHGQAYAVSHLIIDLDPPESDAATWGPDAPVVRTALLVREALSRAGLAGALKTSGAKGLHIVVPVVGSTSAAEAAAATRALAARVERLDPTTATTAYVKDDREGKVFVDSTRSGGATVVAAYSPRARPGVPVSFPITWADVTVIDPRDFTVRTAATRLAEADPWAEERPDPQTLPAELLIEGDAIPVARVQAMHEGKRRKRAGRRPPIEDGPTSP